MANACEAGWTFRCALLSLRMFFGLRLCHSWDIDGGLCSDWENKCLYFILSHETDTERAKAFLEELHENLSESSSPEGAGRVCYGAVNCIGRKYKMSE